MLISNNLATKKTSPTLVLSGGSIRGIAHAGVARAIHEVNLKPERIIGTSIGGLMGAAIAGGMSWKEMEKLSLSVTKDDIAAVDRRVTWPAGVRRPSLFRSEPFRAFIEKSLPWKKFSDLKIPLQINAVDLDTGKMVWFGPGAQENVPLVDAILASTALPLFYPPVKIGGSIYVDGGVHETFPIKRAKEMGGHWILGIDVTGNNENTAKEAVGLGIFGIYGQVFGIMTQDKKEEMLQEWEDTPLVYVRPSVGDIPSFAFDRNAYLLQEGYRATKRALQDAGFSPQGSPPVIASGDVILHRKPPLALEQANSLR